jgi:hypothetical protein
MPRLEKFLRRRNKPRLLESLKLGGHVNHSPRLGEHVNQARRAIVLSRTDAVASAIRTLEIEGM